MQQQLIGQTPAPTLWPYDLDVRYIDGDNWKILAPFAFNSPSHDFPSVVIPAGFVTDFASIPRALWRWMPPVDRRIGKMAVIHDWYYRSPGCPVTRKDADNALRAGMHVLGATHWECEAVWAGVRIGGGHSFKPRRIA